MKKLNSLEVEAPSLSTQTAVIIGGSKAENMRLDGILLQTTFRINRMDAAAIINAVQPPSPLSHVACFILIDSTLAPSSKHCLHALRQRHPHIPVIVIIKRYDAQLAGELLFAGAQECMTQQDVSSHLLEMTCATAKTRLTLENQFKNDLAKVTSRANELEVLAHHDCLTRIPNRASFNSVISRRLYNAMQSGSSLALLYLDLNDFKYVNDTFGHDVGDKLLQLVADRLRQTCRSTDFLARLGGDEFAILTDQMHYRSEVFGLVDRLVKAFDLPFNLNAIQLTCRPAIGVAFYPDGQTPQVLAQQADAAMYLAKNSPSLPVCFYTRKMRHQFSRSIQIRSQLSNAIEQGEFDVHFQKAIDNHDKTHWVFEALLRWHSTFLGNVTPLEFIPAMLKGEMANRLTHLVLQKAALLLAQLPSQSKVTIKINVTASQMASLHYLNQFIAQVSELNIPPHHLCLEVGSKEIGQNLTRLTPCFNAIKQAGLGLSLDHFGVDEVSLKHMLNVPADILSFDKNMIKLLHQDASKRVMVASVVKMAHQLGKQVCMGGVEQEAEHTLVNQLGCDFQQGYFYSHPKPISHWF